MQMTVKIFRKWNLVLGWVVFAIAFITYSLTIEPTVSFWDAGEYIATSAKLQVAHPPGAPLLQMIGVFFAIFATESDQIAKMINYVSVVSSAFTILFMFWTITNLTKKLISQKDKITGSSLVVILGSGCIGSTAFIFSDSFWFNAVETEVYAMASFIMAFLLWLGIQWTDELDTSRGNRWVILISFVVGLTFGIQFMGFLIIPSIGLLYYFKCYKTITIKNFLVANVVAVTILMLIFKFSLTYVLKLFGWSEIFFVNTFGLPFNSGTIIMVILFISIFYIALRHTRKRNMKKTNTVILSMLFILLGFSSWLMLPIRASSKVVINENDPSEALSLLAYYNREQYPSTDSPFYGAYYSDAFASSEETEDERPKYVKDLKLGRYVIVNHYKDALRGHNKKHVGILPRMWSNQNAENYMRYFGVLKFKIKSVYRSSEELKTTISQFKEDYTLGDINIEDYVEFLNEFKEYIDVESPSVFQNLDYMFSFQFGYMYWRYLMWNFVGKQDDVQGQYNNHGNWISGIDFIDELRLGSLAKLPSEIKNNKGRNTYFFLPLILGVIGLIYQARKNPKQFWVLFVFFVFTGIAIQFYTNPTIFQPRERDYSLVGSFYVFAVWIGIGVYGLFDVLRKLIAPQILSPLVILTCLVTVPGVMAGQNWDDHDRSNRFTALSMAKAYLDSTQENANAILFTIGDIDTFPLWYAQDIENYRTDTRIIISTYLHFPWYIDQMKRKAYKSEPIPSQLTHDLYTYGSRDYIYYAPLTSNRWVIKDFIKWVGSDEPRTKLKSLIQKQGKNIDDYSKNYLDAVFYPTNKIRIPVDKKKVLETGLVALKDSDKIVDFIDIDLPKTGISKSRLMMLDIIADNDWERPIYFSGGSFDEEEYIWMSDYLQLDGLAYKLVPIRTKNQSIFDKGRIDSDLLYDIVKKWQWGNSGDANIYHDPQTRRQGISFRISLTRLIEALINEGKLERAKEVLEIAMKNMPLEFFGYFTFVEPFINGYYKVGEIDKARELFNQLKLIYQERLIYYANIPRNEQYEKFENIIGDISAYKRIVDILVLNSDMKLSEEENMVFNRYVDRFSYFFDGGVEHLE